MSRFPIAMLFSPASPSWSRLTFLYLSWVMLVIVSFVSANRLIPRKAMTPSRINTRPNPINKRVPILIFLNMVYSFLKTINKNLSNRHRVVSLLPELLLRLAGGGLLDQHRHIQDQRHFSARSEEHTSELQSLAYLV